MYRTKITISPKCLVTYSNYKELEIGMDFDEVEEILGKHTDVEKSVQNTQAEYEEYLAWSLEDDMWSRYVYHEQIEYSWRNPWTYHTVYATFNDGVLIEKSYH